MNGRCDNDPLDQAANICNTCGGEYCDSCLLYARGRKTKPVCKECAISGSGVRSRGKKAQTGSARGKRKHRNALKEEAANNPDSGGFRFFDEEGSDVLLRDPEDLVGPTEAEEESKKGKKTQKKAKKSLLRRKEDSDSDSESASGESSVDNSDDDSVDVAEFFDMEPSEPSGQPGAADSMPETAPLASQPPPPAADSQPLEDDTVGIADRIASAPSATELLTRLRDAKEASGQNSDNTSSYSVSHGEPWVPSMTAGQSVPAVAEHSVDTSVNPFADSAPMPEPAAPEPAAAFEPAAFTPEPAAAFEPAAFTPEPAAAFEPAAFEQNPNFSPQPPAISVEVSFTPEPAVTPESAFAPEPSFGSEPAPFSAQTFDSESPDADTDSDGNWIPPGLRGMAPQTERDAETLPSRRDEG